MVVVSLTKKGITQMSLPWICFFGWFCNFHDLSWNVWQLLCVSRLGSSQSSLFFDWFHTTLKTQKNTAPQGSLKFSGTKKSEPHRNSRRFWRRVSRPIAWHGRWWGKVLWMIWIWKTLWDSAKNTRAHVKQADQKKVRAPVRNVVISYIYIYTTYITSISRVITPGNPCIFGHS